MKSVLYRLVAIRENKLINWKERITTLEWIQNLSKRIVLFDIRVYFCLFLIPMPLQGFRIDKIFHMNILRKLTPSPSNLFEKKSRITARYGRDVILPSDNMLHWRVYLFFIFQMLWTLNLPVDQNDQMLYLTSYFDKTNTLIIIFRNRLL